MKEKLLTEMEAIDSYVYNHMGSLKQFTIDMIQGIIEELNDENVGLSEQEVIGSLSYRVNTALEICDKNLPDYNILDEIDDTIGKYL